MSKRRSKLVSLLLAFVLMTLVMLPDGVFTPSAYMEAEAVSPAEAQSAPASSQDAQSAQAPDASAGTGATNGLSSTAENQEEGEGKEAPKPTDAQQSAEAPKPTDAQQPAEGQKPSDAQQPAEGLGDDASQGEPSDTPKETGESLAGPTVTASTGEPDSVTPEATVEPLKADWASVPRYAVVNQASAYAVKVSGGVEPYVYKLADGTAVTDFTLVPKSAGTYELNLKILDAAGQEAALYAQIPVSDTKREKPSTWEAGFKNIELTGNWAEDLIAIATTQIGYRESATNFVINEAGKRQGYTRYGHWAGMPYEEWCAMFVSFCLNYADISAADFPRESGCNRWSRALGDLYVRVDKDYTPQPGDLIFFHHDTEDAPSDPMAPNHVGIVERVTDDAVYTIEGNSGKEVQTRQYSLNDSSIVGYANLALAEERARIKAEEEANEAAKGEASSDAGKASDEEIDSENETVEKTPEDPDAEAEKEQPRPERIAVTAGDHINMRAEATTQSATVLNLEAAGTELVVLDTVEGEGGIWLNVRYGEFEGFIRADLLEVVAQQAAQEEDPEDQQPEENLTAGQEMGEEPAETPEETDKNALKEQEKSLEDTAGFASQPVLKLCVKTLLDDVNLHAEASADSEVIASIAESGTEFEVLASVEVEDETWYLVSHEGLEGYIRGDALEALEVSASVPTPAFAEEAVVDGVVIAVTAEEGVFPENAWLSVEKVPVESQEAVDAAVEEARQENRNVALSYTFDIRVLDAEDNELQPAEGQSVQVTFSLAAVANSNVETGVYHVSGENETLTAQPLEVETVGEDATVVTEGFSYYTVEFTYEGKEFVITNEDGIYLSQILEAVGIEGTPTELSFSKPSLFNVCPWEEGDVWFFSTSPFTTEEWMKVTVDGMEYKITLTDDVWTPAGSSNKNFLSGADISTVWIDKTKLTADNATLVQVGGVGGYTITDTGTNEGRISVTGSWYSGVATRIRDFTITYDDAAVLSDGTRKDLVFSFSGVVVHTKELNVDSNLGTNYLSRGTYTIFQTYRDNKGGKSPAIFAIAHQYKGKYYHAGIVYEDVTISVPDANDSDTFFYSVFGLNVDRRHEKNGSPGFSHVHDAFPGWTADANPFTHKYDEAHSGTDTYDGTSGNRLYAEALKPKGSERLYRPSDYAGYEILSDGTWVAKGNPNGANTSYETGFAAQANAQSGFSAKMWQGAPGIASGTDYFLMPDGITHTYVSSSGYYGKIELWSDGLTDVTGTNGDLLYGGRYVERAGIDEKRGYDVPYDKEVTYKMTPEADYIPYKLYVDGAEKALTDENVNIVYKADGTVKYLTYTFPADEIEDEYVEEKEIKGWDPKESKGGFAHTIHITWQPLITLESSKVWDDASNSLKLRPDSVTFTLANYPVNDGIEHHYENNVKPGTPVSGASYTLSASDCAYNTDDEWFHTWYNLPKHTITDPDAATGDLIVYTISETCEDTTRWQCYTELLPHIVEKTDDKVGAQHIANGTDLNHWGFDESGSQNATYDKRTMTYKIVNRLYTGGLVIEKDTLPDGASDDFKFEVTLKHPAADFTTLGFTKAENGKWESTETVSGENLSRVITGLPKGTEYTVTEKVPDQWKLLGSEYTSGTILEGDYWAYDIDGTLYIKDGTSWKNVAGARVSLPTNPTPPLASDPRVPAATYYFDKLGARISLSDSGNYLFGDTGEVPLEATPGWSVSYASQSSEAGQFVIHESPDGRASNTVIGTAVDRAVFQNIKLVDLTVGKQVKGNQASRDKYFKFTVNLEVDPDSYANGNTDFKGDPASVAQDVATILNSWVAELDTSRAVLSPSETVATQYMASLMADENSRDDDPDDTGEDGQQIKFSEGGVIVTFYLQHGQSFTIKDLPYGVNYTVEEDAEDYRPAAYIIKGDAMTRDGTSDEKHITVGDDVKVIEDTCLIADTVLSFTNYRIGVVPTGVVDEIAPGLASLAVALLLGGLLLERRRRRYG